MHRALPTWNLIALANVDNFHSSRFAGDIFIELFGTAKWYAKSSITLFIRFPLSGGAVTLTLYSPSEIFENFVFARTRSDFYVNPV